MVLAWISVNVLKVHEHIKSLKNVNMIPET